MLFFVFFAVNFQLAKLLDHMGHIHPVYQIADQLGAGVCHGGAGALVGDIGGVWSAFSPKQ